MRGHCWKTRVSQFAASLFLNVKMSNRIKISVRFKEMTTLSDFYKLHLVNYRFNIVKYTIEHGPFDSAVSILL